MNIERDARIHFHELGRLIPVTRKCNFQAGKPAGLSGRIKASSLIMVKKKFKSLGLEATFLVPESVADFDANARRQGACLEEAINNVVYRSCLTEFRAKFCERLSAKTGVQRGAAGTGRTDGAGNQILEFNEKEKAFVERVCQERRISVTELQALADEVASEVAFDASGRESAGTVRRIPKRYLTMAQDIVIKGPDAVEKARKKLSEALKRPVLGDADSLALAIKEYQEEPLA
ncbi:MAG: hypothetical protein AAB676_12835 [Verrucomicrobiota bacterium]